MCSGGEGNNFAAEYENHICADVFTQNGGIAAESSRAAERGCEKLFSIMNFDRIGEELAGKLALMVRDEVKSPALTRSPLDRGADALEHMKRGDVRGKIVITM